MECSWIYEINMTLNVDDNAKQDKTDEFCKLVIK